MISDASPRNPTSPRQDTTSVLIVGAGPVGLALSLELSYRGIPCVLLDKGDGKVRLSKMGLVSVRSMEFCRRWGIAQRVRDCGFPADYPLNQVFCTSLNGHLIATIEYPSISLEPTHGLSPEKKQRCPQLWFDPILAKSASEQSSVEMRYEQQLLSLEQDEEGVTAHIRDLPTGEPRTIRAAYLVGCDGAGSTVRNQLGIEFEGDAALSYSVGIYFTAPQLIKYHRMGPAERYMLVGEEGTWGHLTVVDASDVWRLTVLGTQDKVEGADFDADYWVRRCFGSNDVPYQIDAVLPWRRSRLVARRYSDRRVFLAGDACHVMAPNGGYGMNTGLGDAVDIGWKLEAVLKKWAHPALLDSYGAERRPVAWRNVNAAATNFATMAPKLVFDHVELDDETGRVTRHRLQDDLANGTRPEWEVHGINLGYRYEGSPAIFADGTPEPADPMSEYVPTSRPGHRAPHVELPDGSSIIDLFGRGLVLLCFDSGLQTAAEAAQAATPMLTAAHGMSVPVSCHAIAGEAAGAMYERRYVLVRPDGHVAWRSDKLPADSVAVFRHLCGWEGRTAAPVEREVSHG